MATKGYYVYVHRRADTGEVFYVGKGFGKRAWKKTTRSEWWKRIEAKHGRTVEIHADDLDENLAFELEAELITKFGRTNLCNLTDGGDGGVNPSAETRLKMSLARKGRVVSEVTREKMRIASTGRRPSEETKLKLRLANLGKPGRPMSDENKLALSNANKGRVRTLDHRAKISSSKKGVPGHKKTAEECEAIRLRLTGHVVTEETRRKIGKANLGRKHSAVTKAKLKESNGRLNAARRKPVTCSNGMFFEWSGAAEEWLRDNGFPAASRANIVSCCSGNLKSAYGFSWTRDLQ